jgi:hypothetical protein
MLSTRYMCYSVEVTIDAIPAPFPPCRDEDGMVHIFDATGGVGWGTTWAHGLFSGNTIHKALRNRIHAAHQLWLILLFVGLYVGKLVTILNLSPLPPCFLLSLLQRSCRWRAWCR